MTYVEVKAKLAALEANATAKEAAALAACAAAEAARKSLREFKSIVDAAFAVATDSTDLAARVTEKEEEAKPTETRPK